MTDAQSLADFCRTRSPDALADVVRRHVDLVYTTARRLVGDMHLAEDVTQAAFIVLMKKADRLDPRTFPGWLVNTTRLAAKEALRTQRTQIKHETRAAAMRSETSTSVEEPTASVLLPLLDDALSRLSETDRTAVVLRFLQGQSFAEIGAATGSTEEAARKRVGRAVEKLRVIFIKQGVVPSVGGLMIVLAAAQASAAPAALTATVTTAVATGGTATSAVLAKGVASLMIGSKIKLAAMVVLAFMLASSVGIGIELLRRATAKPSATVTARQSANSMADLQGTWDIVSGVRDGVAMSQADLDKEGKQMIISGNRLTIQKNKLEVEKGAFELDVAHQPAWMTVTTGHVGTPEIQTVPGIFELNGNTLKICSDMSGRAVRPTQFASEAGSKVKLWVLRRSMQTFKVTLKDGTTSELVAIGEAATGQWWKPDGTPTAPPYPANDRLMDTVSDRRADRRYLCLVTATARADGSPIQNGGAPTDAFHTRSVIGGSDYRTEIVQIDPAVPALTYPMQMASIPTSTLVKINPASAGGKPIHELSDESTIKGVGLFRIGSMIEMGGQTHFTATWPASVGIIGSAYFPEPVMTDTNGKRVMYSSYSNGNGDHLAKFDLPLARVAEAGIAVTHFDQWVKFTNVSLKPGVRTDVQITTSDTVPADTGFGPIIERTVNGHGGTFDGEGVLGPNMVAIPAQHDDWDKLTAADLQGNQALANAKPVSVAIGPPTVAENETHRDRLTSTWLIRTSGGQLGIIQFETINNSKPPTVKIRYKLLK